MSEVMPIDLPIDKETEKELERGMRRDQNGGSGRAGRVRRVLSKPWATVASIIIALAWTIHHPVVVAIPGASSVAQLESNCTSASAGGRSGGRAGRRPCARDRTA